MTGPSELFDAAEDWTGRLDRDTTSIATALTGLETVNALIRIADSLARIADQMERRPR